MAQFNIKMIRNCLYITTHRDFIHDTKNSMVAVTEIEVDVWVIGKKGLSVRTIREFWLFDNTIFLFPKLHKEADTLPKIAFGHVSAYIVALFADAARSQQRELFLY